MPIPDPMRGALSRILRPLVRLLIVRGLRYPELSDLLKEIYVDASSRYFRLGNKRLTDSRISLLTGLQRKDVKSLRARSGDAPAAQDNQGPGPLPQVLARWVGTAAYTDARGNPLALPRIGETASFATLVAEISRDIHPRTVLDELVRLGLAQFDSERDAVTLLQRAYLPSRDDAALVGYFGANLGDHADAATQNLQAAPEPGRFFERAVHYNELCAESLAELDALARQVQGDALAALNARAQELQARDAAAGEAKGRFRCGAFIYHSCDARTPEAK